MADLDTLRPEVREAAAKLDDFDSAFGTGGHWQIIRAELLRLAGENAELREQTKMPAVAWQQRTEKAEAELAALKDNHRGLLVGTTHDGQPCGLRGTHESVSAVSDELEELAARHAAGMNVLNTATVLLLLLAAILFVFAALMQCMIGHLLYGVIFFGIACGLSGYAGVRTRRI